MKDYNDEQRELKKKSVVMKSQIAYKLFNQKKSKISTYHVYG